MKYKYKKIKFKLKHLILFYKIKKIYIIKNLIKIINILKIYYIYNYSSIIYFNYC